MSASNNFIQEDEVLGKAYDARLVRRLWSFVGDQKSKILLAAALMIVGALAALAGPLLVKVAIDRYIAQRDWNGLMLIVLLFVGLAVIAATLRWCETYLTGSAGQYIIYRMRMRLYEKLQQLSIPYYDRNPVGRLMSRLTSDVQALYEFFSSGVAAITGDVVILVGIIIVLVVISWKLALITLTVIPFLIAATFIFRRHVRDLYRLTRLKIAKLNSYLHENLVGMRVVQLYNRETRNYETFDEIGRDLKETFLRTVFFYAVFYPVVELISAVAVALVLFGGGGMMLSGTVTLGTLIAFIQYIERFWRPVRDLAEKYNILQGAMAAAERVFKVMDNPVEVPPSNGCFEDAKNALTLTDTVVEFRNVWFAYCDEDWVLKDVSFRVAAGESIAVVGATGAGKTTLISLMSRFYDVQKGQVSINGIDVREWDLRQLRRLMGIVLQDVFIFAGTIEDNIRYGCPKSSLDDVKQAAELVHADRFIARLPRNYQEPVMERGATLSTGERQLLAFARAVLCKPPIIILDEATASIDTETERLIQDAISRLLTGRTSIIIAHRLSTIQRCDRILVFHHGHLREEGTQEELLAKRGIFYRLWQLQFGHAFPAIRADAEA